MKLGIDKKVTLLIVLWIMFIDLDKINTMIIETK